MNALTNQWRQNWWMNGKSRLRLARAAVYVLLVLLVWQLARLMLLLLSGPAVPPAVVPPLPEWRNAGASRTSGLAQWHLFGEAPAGLDLSAFAQLPETPLKLTLRGIVASSDKAGGGSKNEGYALITDERGVEDVYRRGDEVPGGAEVVSIQPDQVILLRNGKRETLRLPGGAQLTNGSRGGATGTNNGGGANAPALSPASMAKLPGIRAPSQPISVSGAVSQVPGLRLNAAALANSIQIAPVTGGGFRVFPGRNAQIFSQLGLQANDVVTQVNGKPLNSQADALAIFQQVQGGQSVTITVRRGDREVILKPDVKTLLNNQP